MADKFTLGKFVAVRALINKLLEIDGKSPLKIPGKTRLALVQLAIISNRAGAEYDKAKDGAIAQHGTKTEDGGYKIEPNTPAMDAFNLAHAALWDGEPVDIPTTFPVLNADDLAEDHSIPIATIAALIELGVAKQKEAGK